MLLPGSAGHHYLIIFWPPYPIYRGGDLIHIQDNAAYGTMQEYETGFILWIICVYIAESVPTNLTSHALLTPRARAAHNRGLYDLFFII